MAKKARKKIHFDTVTQKQLDMLPLPEKRWRLDQLLKARLDLDPRTRTLTGGFETLNACWQEDRRRAQALRQAPKKIKSAFGGDADALADLLETGAEQKVAPASCASAAYMRGRRLAFLGSLLQVINDNPNLELGLTWVCEREWYLGLHDDLEELEDNIHTRFRRLLNSIRVWDFPGFLVACVNGQFNVSEKKIQFTFTGLYAGEKLRASKIWDNDDQLQPAAQSGEEIKDLPQQICELIPNCIIEGDPDFVKIEKPRRMREPYRSLYLMWLAHCSLADRMLLDDISVQSTGLVLERTSTCWWTE